MRKKNLNFDTPLALHRGVGTGFGAIFPYFHLISKYVVYIFFVISLDIELNIVYHDPLIYFRIFFEFFAIFYVKLHKLL